MGNKSAFMEELGDEATFYLVDEQLPMPAKARRIETCLPSLSLHWVRRHLNGSASACLQHERRSMH